MLIAMGMLLKCAHACSFVGNAVQCAHVNKAYVPDSYMPLHLMQGSGLCTPGTNVGIIGGVDSAL
jgi:hypothetical protein